MSDRVVVVTGASAGVGRAVAREFGGCGDAVALLARGQTGLAAAADDVRSSGGVAVTLSVDVSQPLQVSSAAQQVEQELGPIDIWINAAFTSVFAPFMEITAEEFRRVTDVSYLGYVYGTRAALDHMLPRDSGTIVQVGSALAYRGIPLQSAYCGAKHAIQGFNESLRCELLHQRSRVRTTMVQLPAVNTPQFEWVLSRLPRKPQPVPPIYQPELVAKAVRYAAEHPRRREYWVGETTAATMLANGVVPGLLDRYLGRTAYSSQQTQEPREEGRPVNLWEPLDGADGRDFGVHGSFDDVSHGLAPGLGLAAPWFAGHRCAGRRHGRHRRGPPARVEPPTIIRPLGVSPSASPSHSSEASSFVTAATTLSGRSRWMKWPLSLIASNGMKGRTYRTGGGCVGSTSTIPVTSSASSANARATCAPKECPTST